VADSWLVEAIVVIYCKIGQIIFVYLGLPIVENPRRRSFRLSLFDHIRQKLSKWKSKNFSMGGRKLAVHWIDWEKICSCWEYESLGLGGLGSLIRLC